jgi:hypothetical protein
MSDQISNNEKNSFIIKIVKMTIQTTDNYLLLFLPHRALPLFLNVAFRGNRPEVFPQGQQSQI